ncbi:MAG: hypothetical protein V8T31_01325 [Lachnospiraceae bacterium]
MSMELGAIHYMVIGTGINANVTEFQKKSGYSHFSDTGKGGKGDRAAITVCPYGSF